MWPWEHLAIGYLIYSLSQRRLAGRSPTSRETVALAFGTQFPDLVDKPLGWIFHLLPSGVSLAHSALVAGPTALGLLVLAATRDWASPGVPFAVGYLSHLPGDAFYGIVVGGAADASFLMWPLVPQESAIGSMNVLQYVRTLFTGYLSHLAQSHGLGYVLFEVGLLAFALLVWHLDGQPLRPGSAESSSEPETMGE